MDEPNALVRRIRLDFRAKQPLYLQLSEQIRAQIETGQLSAEETLPPVRSLAQALQINFNTVARAYRLLDIEGWISTQPGRGTYITPHSWPGSPNLESPFAGVFTETEATGQPDQSPPATEDIHTGDPDQIQAIINDDILKDAAVLRTQSVAPADVMQPIPEKAHPDDGLQPPAPIRIASPETGPSDNLTIARAANVSRETTASAITSARELMDAVSRDHLGTSLTDREDQSLGLARETIISRLLDWAAAVGITPAEIQARLVMKPDINLKQGLPGIQEEIGILRGTGPQNPNRKNNRLRRITGRQARAGAEPDADERLDRIRRAGMGKVTRQNHPKNRK